MIASAKEAGLVCTQDGNLHLVCETTASNGSGRAARRFTYEPWQVVAPMPNRRSCTRATGSVDSVFYRAAEGTMWINTADNTARHIAPMRPPCQDGVVIANGMLYWGPWMCGCPLSFYGHVALAPAGDYRSPPGTQESRLEPGEGDPQAVQKLVVQPGDWPC